MMRRLWMAFIGIMIAGSVWAGAIPSQITYQGTLKEKGIPASGLHNMNRSAPVFTPIRW